MMEMSFLGSIAKQVGCKEAALRLIISALLGYPICIVYSFFFTKKPNYVKHIYFFISGLYLLWFIHGINTIHSMIICIFAFITLKLFGGSQLAVSLNFIFCMLYLSYGYYITQTGLEYSFTWTIPQCVMTLRLIALSFDIYDGKRNEIIRKKFDDEDDLKKSQPQVINEENAITKVPNLLELLSHAYFPGSIIMGPLISFKKYQEYILSTENMFSQSWLPGFTRLLLGLIYLAIYQFGSIIWPLEYLNSKELEVKSFLTKATIIALVTKISFCKYISGWLISEGVCMVSGVVYDKKTNSYYSYSNIDVIKFETTPTFDGIIKSFNITTNTFAATYIFKRLKFIGSKVVSHFLTLFFLALWHGWSTGYYVTFLMEFLIMKMEWEVLSILRSVRSRYKQLDLILNTFYFRWPLLIVFRIYTIYMLGYCLIPFTLLSYHKWYPVLKQVYFCGHILYGTWFFLSFFLPKRSQ